MSAPFMSRVGRLAAGVRRHRVVWAVLGSLGFGLIAALGARNYIQERLDVERQRLAPAPQATVEVVVASRALQVGETVSAETMALRALPSNLVPASVVTPERFEAMLGARLMVAMNAGEPLLSGAVESTEQASIASRVPRGIRAMTIAVDEVNALSGMLQPGDRIDLLWSVRPSPEAGAGAAEVTRMMLQDVRVLATGRQLHPPPKDGLAEAPTYTTITVEVGPEQAQKLIIAQRHGALTAVLRNPEDRGPAVVQARDLNTVLGVASAPPESSRTLAPEVIVGGRGSVQAASTLLPSWPVPLRADKALPQPPMPAGALPEPRPEPGPDLPQRLDAPLERLLSGS